MPGMQIAVGGCLAQMDKQTVLDKAPWVDVVFGTHNMGSLPSMLERARHNGEAELEILESLEIFPSTLPTKRDSVYSGWVSISVGCNNTCTFCIVPSLRGKEKDRRPGDILNEIQPARRRRRHRGDAARPERQLLRCRVRRPPGVRQAPARRGRDRRARAHPLHEPAPRGLHRRRHRCHGRDAIGDAPAAHAAAVRQRPHPQGHAPLLPQRAVPRHPRPRSRRGCRTPPSRPTSSSASQARPTRTSKTPCGSSSRRGSRAPSRSSTRSAKAHRRRRCPTRSPRRSCRSATSGSIALQERISHEENQKQVGREVAGARLDGRGQEGCRDTPPHRARRRQPARALRGARGFGACPAPAMSYRSSITHAAPFHLIADAPDGAPLRIRRTRAGDAWDRTQAESCALPDVGGFRRRSPKAVSLGLPTLRVGV